MLPPIEDVAAPGERPILNELLKSLVRAGADDKAQLAAADVALAKVPRATALRGFIQFVRATALSQLNRELDAVDAAEESVRLLPTYSGPLILASFIYAYADRPTQATEYLIRASTVDPATVRTVDDYEIGNIIKRLQAVGDVRRIQALSDRLLEIGWLGTHLSSRSSLALEAIKRKLAEGDADKAAALLPKLLVPGHSRALLMMKANEPVWPAIQEWAGPKLARQWSIYLTEARNRWTGSKSADATQDYVGALRQAGHYKTIVRDALPLYTKVDKLADYDLLFSVYSVAQALARLDRWKDANDLFERAQRIWPLGEHANALNITANYAQFLLVQDKPGLALARMDVALADARKWGPEVNFDAFAGMHHYRACILHQLGRDAEAGISMATAMRTQRGTDLAGLHLCMGDNAAAKSALLAALDNQATREGVLAFLQRPSEPPLNTVYERRIRAAEDALRGDPELLEKAANYGRILDFTPNEGAPREVL